MSRTIVENYVCKVDFANLIRNLNDHLFKMIIYPSKRNIAYLTSWLIYESCLEPNKIKLIGNILVLEKHKINTADYMLKCNQLLCRKNGIKKLSLK